MSRILVGIFMTLHGLVHLWYFTLSRGLVAFRPEMGWSGRSWLLSKRLGDKTTRTLASALYILATIGFVVGGIGIITQQEWWYAAIIGSAVFSTVVIVLLWDGDTRLLVQKGLVGLLINAVTILALLVLGQSPDIF